MRPRLGWRGLGRRTGLLLDIISIIAALIPDLWARAVIKFALAFACAYPIGGNPAFEAHRSPAHSHAPVGYREDRHALFLLTHVNRRAQRAPSAATLRAVIECVYNRHPRHPLPPTPPAALIRRA